MYSRREQRRRAASWCVLQGLKMRELPDHLEVVITDDDVDEDCRPLDCEAVLRPYRAQTRAIDTPMVEALEDTQ
jgi:hypothetical protein